MTFDDCCDFFNRLISVDFSKLALLSVVVNNWFGQTVEDSESFLDNLLIVICSTTCQASIY
jgi:hypothetical protein